MGPRHGGAVYGYRGGAAQGFTGPSHPALRLGILQSSSRGEVERTLGIQENRFLPPPSQELAVKARDRHSLSLELRLPICGTRVLLSASSQMILRGPVILFPGLSS